jgi:hypothetical protein
MGHLGTLWGAKEMTGLDRFGAAERARARPVAEARRGRQARAEECAAPLSSVLRASCSLVHLPARSRAWARVTDARGVPHCSWHADAHSLRLSTLAPRRGSPMRAILTCATFHHSVAWPFSEWGRFPNRTPLRTAKRTAKLLPRAHGALAGRAGCGGGALASNHTGSNASAVPVPSGPCGIPPHSCATYEAPADLAAIITSIPANVRALPPPCLAPPRAARRRAVERAGVCGCAPGARGDGPWPVRVRPHGPGLGPSVLHVSGRCR